MKLNGGAAEWFVPDGEKLDLAISRTTHLGIGAHQDDLEIMAFDGILQCFSIPDKWFTGIVVTDGAGSPRNGLYSSCSDTQMKNIRRAEQRKAAYVGEYSALAQLNYSSAAVKDPKSDLVEDDILQILKAAKPQTVYIHNLADKHPTHVAAALRAIGAIRRLPKDALPQKLYGCEIWRGLDWMPADRKVLFDVSGHPNLSSALISVFDSQICGGKRYDLATEGRRVANATYGDSHSVDTVRAAIYAMDLTPLIEDASMSISDYVLSHIRAFAQDVQDKLGTFGR